MASLPNSTTSGIYRVFNNPGSERGLATIKRLADGAVISAFCRGFAPQVNGINITQITPFSAKVGDQVTITGTGFTLGNITAIHFGNGYITQAPSLVNATTIVCVVPGNNSVAYGDVRVDTTAGNSNVYPFTINP